MEVNNRKRKSNKFPATPLAFYIKIYCKQKASLKTKVNGVEFAGFCFIAPENRYTKLTF